jgi:hypothetical protein
MEEVRPREIAIPSKTAALKSLVKKLIRAASEIQTIPKRSRNETSGYVYAAAEDIIQAVRGPLSKCGLLVYSTLKERTSEAIRTAQGRGAWRERLVLRFVVTDGEAEIAFDAPGEGQDEGDKATYKAITGATKYALRQLLQLPIGEDPEAESPVTVPASRGLGGGTHAPDHCASPESPAEPSHGSNGSGNGSITPRQLEAIDRLCKAASIEEAHLAQILEAKFGVDGTARLTKSQASQLITLLENTPLQLPPAQ